MILFRTSCSLLLLLTTMLWHVVCCAPAALGQDEEDQVIPWEYRPYRVQLYVAFDNSPWYASARRSRLLRSFEQQSFREGGSAWEVEAIEIPPSLAGFAAEGIDRLTLDQVMAFDEKLVDQYDKLIFLRLSEENLVFHAEARELDCRTRYWGPTRRREAIQAELIASQAYDAVLKSFAPLLRVGRKLEGETVDCSLRAGYLITQPSSPAKLHKNEILLPITRHNARDGQPRPDGIVPSPWTFLSVNMAKGGKTVCDIHSGVRNSIGARSSRRKERLALSIRLEGQPTQLLLQTGSEEPKPLVGYELHAKNPFTDSSFEFLGRTNWAGKISIPPGEAPLRVLYVKNGDRVLNRLPMMPGLEDQLIAELPDDSRRLEAEGFASGVEAQIMDLVAQRAIMAASLRRELDQDNMEGAEQWMNQYRELPSQGDLAVQLEQEQRRIVSSTEDTRLRSRIDAVFNNVRSLVTALIDPGEEGRLAAEIAAAKAGTRPQPAPPAEEKAAAEESAEETPSANEADPAAAFGSGPVESEEPPAEESPSETTPEGDTPKPEANEGA